MLLQGKFLPAPRIEQAAHPVEAKSRGFGNGLDALEAQSLKQDRMKLQVKAVKAGVVTGCHGSRLIAQVLFQGFDMIAGDIAGHRPHRFHFNGPAQEHVLPGIGNLDQADRRSALRDHVNEGFGLQPGEGIIDGGAGDAEALDEDLLVQNLAGLEFQGHNRFAQHQINMIAGTASGALPGRGRYVETHRCIIHTNMLV